MAEEDRAVQHEAHPTPCGAHDPSRRKVNARGQAPADLHLDDTSPNTTQAIPLSKLRPDPTPLRREYDLDALAHGLGGVAREGASLKRGEDDGEPPEAR